MPTKEEEPPQAKIDEIDPEMKHKKKKVDELL